MLCGSMPATLSGLYISVGSAQTVCAFAIRLVLRHSRHRQYVPVRARAVSACSIAPLSAQSSVMFHEQIKAYQEALVATRDHRRVTTGGTEAAICDTSLHTDTGPFLKNRAKMIFPEKKSKNRRKINGVKNTTAWRCVSVAQTVAVMFTPSNCCLVQAV